MTVGTIQSFFDTSTVVNPVLLTIYKTIPVLFDTSTFGPEWTDRNQPSFNGSTTCFLEEQESWATVPRTHFSQACFGLVSARSPFGKNAQNEHRFPLCTKEPSSCHCWPTRHGTVMSQRIWKVQQHLCFSFAGEMHIWLTLLSWTVCLISERSSWARRISVSWGGQRLCQHPGRPLPLAPA